MDFAVLIPAYNEADCIGGLLRRLRKYVKPQDIIVVDDGSSDGTGDIARDFGVKVLVHPRNRGKGAAQRTGFSYIVEAGYDGVITMDGDGQHDPDEIPLFISKAEEGYDIIIGMREGNISTMPLDRYLVNRTTSLVVSLFSGVRVRDSQCGYRFIRRGVMEKVPLSTTKFQTESEMLIKASRIGFKIGEVPIRTIYTDTAKSYIDPVVDTIRFISLSIRSFWR